MTVEPEGEEGANTCNDAPAATISTTISAPESLFEELVEEVMRLLLQEK